MCRLDDNLFCMVHSKVHRKDVRKLKKEVEDLTVVNRRLWQDNENLYKEKILLLEDKKRLTEQWIYANKQRDKELKAMYEEGYNMGCKDKEYEIYDTKYDIAKSKKEFKKIIENYRDEKIKSITLKDVFKEARKRTEKEFEEYYNGKTN